MKIFQLIIVVIFSTVIVLGFADKQGKVEKTKTAKSKTVIGVDNDQSKSKAPDFDLRSTEGKQIKLSDFKGKIVILDFWATWCGPCRIGIPDLVDIQNKYKDKVAVLGISLDEISGTANDLKPFMKQFKINYPVVLGTEKLNKEYGDIQAIPTSFIIDQKGNIIKKHVGLAPKEEFIDQIKSLLSKS